MGTVEKEKIAGKFNYCVFNNKATEYSVCLYKDADGKKFTCTGFSLPTTKGITYLFTATPETTKYGKSYRVESWTEEIKGDKAEVIAYLASGMFPGISTVTADRIYAHFGKETLSILENDLDRLSEVKGIGKKTIAKVKVAYKEKREDLRLIKVLTKYGVTSNATRHIKKMFHENAFKTIEENPYALCRVHGITFETADRIAMDKGHDPASWERIKAAASYVLMEDIIRGNVCMPKIDFGNKLLAILSTPSINRANITTYVVRLMEEKEIKYNKRQTDNGIEEYFYLPATYAAERRIARNIVHLLSQKKDRDEKKADRLIEQHMKSSGIMLDDTQKKAIKIGVTEPVFLITGGPGTGKTTILKLIAQINEEKAGRDNNVLMAPTGRAARRMAETSGYPAATAHSTLGLTVDDDDTDGVQEGTTDPIKNSRILIDEASMLDLWLMDAVLEQIENSSLGLIGDIDQLPSVRCGTVLKDLIDSGVIPCIRLENVYRQAGDAEHICNNALRIKHGDASFETGDDFMILDAQSLETAEEKVTEAALYQIKKYGLSNVRVLCPFIKGICGVFRVNSILQAKLNPLMGRKELKIAGNMTIRPGDPVMQLKNKVDVSNGDIGTVTSVSDNEVFVQFDFRDGIITRHYEKEAAREELTLAYAMTVHKSQGSEYDSVILCMTEQHGIMRRRNILYTGITRGKHQVTLVGTEKAFTYAVNNNMIDDRHSMLAQLIKDFARTAEITTKPTEKKKDMAPARHIAQTADYTQIEMVFA